MVTLPGLTDLQTRKRDLLLESDMNRQIFQLELEQIRFRTGQWKKGYDRVHVGWKWIAPIAGFLFARKAKSAQGLFAKGSMMLLAGRKLWDVWQQVRGARKA